MKTPQRYVTAADLPGPDRGLGRATATYCRVIMLGFRIVLAMAFLSPDSAGPGQAPSGSGRKRHSWRPPRSARSVMGARPASLAGESDSPGLTNVTEITNPDPREVCVIVSGVLKGEGISSAAGPTEPQPANRDLPDMRRDGRLPRASSPRLEIRRRRGNYVSGKTGPGELSMAWSVRFRPPGSAAAQRWSARALLGIAALTALGPRSRANVVSTSPMT
jgi:hypothetical protein